MLFLAI